MKISVTPLRVAFAFMMTPALIFFAIFFLVLRTGKDQLILIMLTNVVSFYAGMGSTASTMMTGKDFFHSADDDDSADAVPPPSKVTTEIKKTVETAPEPTPGDSSANPTQ